MEGFSDARLQGYILPASIIPMRTPTGKQSLNAVLTDLGVCRDFAVTIYNTQIFLATWNKAHRGGFL